MKNNFRIISASIFVLFQAYAFGQPLPDNKGDEESFFKLEDGIIKREIATFNNASAIFDYKDSLPSAKLEKIPLLSCSNDFISFESGNWVSTNLHVTIESKPFVADSSKIGYADSAHQWIASINNLPVWGTDGGIPKNQIVAVDFWFHVHDPQELPASAFAGLYEPNFCPEEYLSWGKEKQPEPEKLFCSVYRSEDKKRVYIYMLNGDGAGGYEVTWVIQDHKYLMRVIDYGF